MEKLDKNKYMILGGLTALVGGGLLLYFFGKDQSVEGEAQSMNSDDKNLSDFFLTEELIEKCNKMK